MIASGTPPNQIIPNSFGSTLTQNKRFFRGIKIAYPNTIRPPTQMIHLTGVINLETIGVGSQRITFQSTNSGKIEYLAPQAPSKPLTNLSYSKVIHGGYALYTTSKASSLPIGRLIGNSQTGTVAFQYFFNFTTPTSGHFKMHTFPTVTTVKGKFTYTP